MSGSTAWRHDPAEALLEGHGRTGVETVPEPLLPEVGVMAFVPNSWRDLRRGRHHLMFGLATYFRVMWVQPSRHWRQLLRGGPLRPEDPIRLEDLPDGLMVDEPGLRFPVVHRPHWLGTAFRRAHWRRAHRELLRRGCRRVILYLWRPGFAPVLDVLPHDVSCYHLDDEYTFSDTEQPVGTQERRLLESVDQVFVVSPGLMEKKGRINPRTRYVSIGVDYDAFSASREEPADLARVPRPRIGYAGILKHQLDWDLLEELARRQPGWSFVFVGAPAEQPGLHARLERIDALPNVHFLGARSTATLPAYPQHFDVCVMPYRQISYTRYINPLKLYEYLASGRPVVTTSIRSVEEYPDLVLRADDVEGWQRALARALAPDENGASRREARRRAARRHDWEHLVRDVAGTLAHHLPSDLAGRLAAEKPWS